MSNVIRFPVKHQFIACEALPEVGGCSVCCGWEGEVPTDCPGEPMTKEQKDAVLEGRLDYIAREGWTTETKQMRRIRRMICEEGFVP